MSVATGFFVKFTRRLRLLFLALGAVISIAFTIGAYQSLRFALLAGADEQLRAAAYAVDELFSDDYHRAISGPASVSPERFLEGMRRLSRYADRAGFAYVYTYMRVDGQVVTTATSATPEEWRDGTQDVFFNLYDTAPPEVDLSFDDGQTRFLSYTDGYGAFRSIFMPMDTGDGRRYLIGADLSLDSLHAELRELLWLSLAIGGGVFLLTLILSELGSRPLVRPLLDLTGLTSRLAESNFQIDHIDGQSLRTMSERRDEVGTLAQAQMEMLSRLQAFLVELEREVAKREHTEGELAVARAIQLGMLPQLGLDERARRRCHLEAEMIAAREVGGDLYDYFMLDERRLFIAIGDVAGKGPGAALFMAVTLTLIKAHAQHSGCESPAALLERVNDELERDNPQQLFVTMIAGVLDLDTGVLVYADAGHDAPLIVRAGGLIEDVEKLPGMALGVWPSFQFAEARLQLEPGDVLVFFTDGVTEAMDANEALFSRDRLKRTLAEIKSRPTNAQDALDSILAAVQEFAAGQEQADDITLLVVGRREPGSDCESVNRQAHALPTDQ